MHLTPLHSTPQRQNLQDQNRRGKNVEWRVKRKTALQLGDSFERLAQINPVMGERYTRRAANICQCAQYLNFNPTVTGEIKLANAYFCKMPLCPVCAWRRSEKLYGQTGKVISHLEASEANYAYILLTLTVKNVSGPELSGALDGLSAAWNRLVRRTPFKKAVKGWLRSTEITHNWKSGEFHPHLHILLAVDREYLTDKKNYIDHGRWMKLWQESLRVDYDPWVDIRRVKKEKDKLGRGLTYAGAIAEVAKYTSKPADYMVPWWDKKALRRFEKDNKVLVATKKQADAMTDEVVSWLDPALHKRRRTGMGGIFKETHKLLNLDDLEDGDLVNTDNEEEKAVVDKNTTLVYSWSRRFEDYMLYRIYRVEDGEEYDIPLEDYEKACMGRRYNRPPP